MSVKMRIEVEKKIAAAVIKSALAAGYTVGIDNGDNSGGGEDAEYEYKGTNKKELNEKLMATDEDRLYLFRGPNSKRPFAWVYFVYGNDGWDVISDYSTNIEELLAPALAIAEHYQ